MAEPIIWLTTIVVAVVTFARLRQYGGNGWPAVWLGVLILVPAWFNVGFRTIEFGPRFVVCYLVFGYALFRPFTGQRPNLYLADLALALLLAYMIFSEFAARVVAPLGLLMLVMRWALPYGLGRIFFKDERDFPAALSAVCVCAPIVCLLGLFESLTEYNPIDRPLGRIHDIDPTARLGLYRANVTYSHPNAFGLAVGMMLPWLLEAARWARRGVGPKWWAFPVWFALVGILATGSRSAQLMTLVVFWANLAYQWRASRWPLIIGGGLVLVVALAFRSEALELLSAYAGEKDPGANIVIINGKEYPYTGTSHRDLLAVVYEDALKKLPTFGYGSQTTVEELPVDKNMDTRFKSIDNHYLLFRLQHGDAANYFFLLFGILAVVQFIPVIRADSPFSGLAATLAASSAFFLVILRGIWLIPQLLIFWIFLLGLAGSLCTWQRRNEQPVSPGVPDPDRQTLG